MFNKITILYFDADLNIYKKTMKIEIENRWSGVVIFAYECEENTISITLSEAIKRSANLSGADLSGADLSGADLRSANLSGANLSGADLSGADLSGADLRRANLSGADLRSADLRSADLRSADLRSANLRSAILSGANLSGANLTPIKNDLFVVLLTAIPEIPNLKKSILEGKINGSTYEGECACLCGTLEKTDNKIIKKAVFDRRDSSRPIERFFLGIEPGNTPENNQAAALVLEWIEEFETYLPR